MIAAPRIPPSLVADLIRFADRHAHGIAIGIVDLDGGQQFAGGDHALRALSALSEASSSPAAARPQDLFSDLNQWMLKILLAPRIPAELLQAPRGEYRNVSEWAKAAGVSVMHAFRIQQQLLAEGFLDEGAPVVKLVRLPELLRRWHAAYLRPVRDLPMRFFLPGRDRAAQLHAALRRYASNEEQPRACLAMKDTDIALDPASAPPSAEIRERLLAAGFTEEFLGNPSSTTFAEFLVPLTGGASRRDGHKRRFRIRRAPSGACIVMPPIASTLTSMSYLT